DRARVTRILAKPRRRRTARDVAWMRDLIDRTGALTHARQVAHGLAGAALFEFDQIFGGMPPGRGARFNRTMVTWGIQRTDWRDHGEAHRGLRRHRLLRTADRRRRHPARGRTWRRLRARARCA